LILSFRTRCPRSLAGWERAGWRFWAKNMVCGLRGVAGGEEKAGAVELSARLGNGGMGSTWHKALLGKILTTEKTGIGHRPTQTGPEGGGRW